MIIYIYLGFIINQPIAMIKYDLWKIFKKDLKISISVKNKFEVVGIDKKLLLDFKL